MAVEKGEVHNYKEGRNLQDSFDYMQLDHIPSKQAIKEAYANVVGKPSVADLDKDTKREIDNITTILVRSDESHKLNDTTGGRNKVLAVVDSKVLALASVRDLEKYRKIEIEVGDLSSQQINTAINNVHEKNIDLGIYSQREVNIAKEFADELKDIDIKNNKEHIPTFEEVATRYDTRLEVESTPKMFNEGHFSNRLAKPSIIVGATLASMVFTEKADASTIPILHLNSHLSKDNFDSLSNAEQIGAQIGAGFNGINAIQASEEFKAGASKSPSTLLDSNAYKEGFKEISQDAIKPVLTKDVVQMGVKDSAKFAGKSLLKKLPIVGFVAGIGFGIGRAMDGDWEGAAMEVASGAASIVPGVGTTASVGIDAVLLERDTGILSHGANKLLGKDKIEEKVLIHSEDNHTTIEVKQDINLSNDLDQEALEQRVAPQSQQTLTLNQVQDKQSNTVPQIDTYQKSQEMLADLYPHLVPHLGMTDRQERREIQKEEPNPTQDNYSRNTNTSSDTFENNSYYIEDDFSSMPKNHRPTNLPNNLPQQPLEEDTFDSTAKANEIVEKMFEDNGWNNNYDNSNDMGRDID